MYRTKRAEAKGRPSSPQATVVAAFLAGGKTVAEVARQFDLSERTVRQWIRQASDEVLGAGPAGAERHPSPEHLPGPDAAPAELEAQALAMFQSGGKTIAEIAYRLNLAESMVREWIWHSSIDIQPGAASITARAPGTLDALDDPSFVPEVLGPDFEDRPAVESTLGSGEAAAPDQAAEAESKAAKAAMTQAEAEKTAAEAVARAEAAAEAEAAARAEITSVYAAAVEAIVRAEVAADEAVSQAYAAAAESMTRAEAEVTAAYAIAVEAMVRAEVLATEKVVGAEAAAAAAVAEAQAAAAAAEAAAADAEARSKAAVAEAIARSEAAAAETEAVSAVAMNHAPDESAGPTALEAVGADLVRSDLFLAGAVAFAPSVHTPAEAEAAARAEIAQLVSQLAPVEVWVHGVGRTLSEAREAALEELGVDAADAEIELLEKGPRWLPGRVRVRARMLRSGHGS